MQWEDSTELVKLSILETLLMEAILILKMTETNHIDTAKVLIEELTSSLIIEQMLMILP